MATQQRKLDSKGAMSVLNSRQTISRNHIGEQVQTFVQGNGTFVSADEQREADVKAKKEPAANYFDKYIFNVKANSAEAMSRKETKALLSAALKAESAGEMDEAHDLYNKWLNACQISFNQIVNPGQRKLEDGDAITAIVGEAETKAGYMALTVNSVRYKRPATLETVKYDLRDLYEDDAEPETPEVIADKTAAKSKKTGK